MFDLEGNSPLRCDFCNEVILPLNAVAGSTSFICRKCASLIHSDTEKRSKLEKELKSEEGDYEVSLKKPMEIRAELDKWVVGQEEAKRKISVAIYHHYLRVKRGLPTQGKNNLLLIGPSGCGKTFLVQTMAKTIGLPLYIGDATTLTEAGYVGQDVESILKGLLNAAGGNPNYARKGIIYLDEIDKIAERLSPSTGRDVGGGGVQEALLKMIEGKVCTFPTSSGSHVTLDTSEILFIFGGAFSDLTRFCTIEKKNTIGFGQDISFVKETLYDDIVHSIGPKELKKYGLKPEFVGRVPVVVHFKSLTKDELCKILTDVNDSVIKMVKEIFLADNITVEIPQETIEAIAEEAMNTQNGARGLRVITEESLFNCFYSYPGSEIKRFVFTKDMVKNHGGG